MCLIAFAIDSHPRYPLVLVANRDEFRDRPTEPAHFWPDAPHVLGGRDGRAGGTWLGVTTGGKLAAITNYRDARYQVVHPPSRGLLVADYLRDEAMTPADLQAHLIRHGEEYDGFNLIYGTCRELHYFTNRGGSSGPVSPGVHALSNHLLDTSWPKVIAARARLSKVVRQAGLGSDELLGLLADPAPFNSRLLPDTGLGPERERLLSPLFIEGEQYGTRSTTVITVDSDGKLTFVEQGHDVNDAPRRDFSIQV
ncbi:NRDE family protein [Pelotalea chapellei]|uniref:NRDE family protein n=1 Tax=Pelotalea chapellei TaxID=44671 RepID=A0ABS5U3H7_9BACT|nr:NRDE family protein [Pelotalea chapellei]MBT1070227.1 NRDE family protein [Pelotalea chapellei]